MKWYHCKVKKKQNKKGTDVTILEDLIERKRTNAFSAEKDLKKLSGVEEGKMKGPKRKC